MKRREFIQRASAGIAGLAIHKRSESRQFRDQETTLAFKEFQTVNLNLSEALKKEAEVYMDGFIKSNKIDVAANDVQKIRSEKLGTLVTGIKVRVANDLNLEKDKITSLTDPRIEAVILERVNGSYEISYKFSTVKNSDVENIAELAIPEYNLGYGAIVPATAEDRKVHIIQFSHQRREPEVNVLGAEITRVMSIINSSKLNDEKKLSLRSRVSQLANELNGTRVPFTQIQNELTLILDDLRLSANEKQKSALDFMKKQEKSRKYIQ